MSAGGVAVDLRIRKKEFQVGRILLFLVWQMQRESTGLYGENASDDWSCLLSDESAPGDAVGWIRAIRILTACVGLAVVAIMLYQPVSARVVAANEWVATTIMPPLSSSYRDLAYKPQSALRMGKNEPVIVEAKRWGWLPGQESFSYQISRMDFNRLERESNFGIQILCGSPNGVRIFLREREP